MFPNGWSADAAALSPAAIAARWPQLDDLIEGGIPSLTHAVIALALSPEELLSETQRDRLWRAFRVPVFEQIVTENGALLAAECEAHDGFHIEAPSLAFDPCCIEVKPCGCGRTTPRLKPTGMRVQAIAAYAR
ncbi:MAG: hypothetical protein JO307_00170 [Bryobacterales bacterium]|nr:hypothetical protein [Bryobacterales bacterium]